VTIPERNGTRIEDIYLNEYSKGRDTRDGYILKVEALFENGPDFFEEFKEHHLPVSQQTK
jgi:hypothetical protein